MNLRPYQLQAVEALLGRRGERPLLCLATGSGKTVVICEVLRRTAQPSLVLAHRRELIHQARDRLAQHGIEAGLILVGEPRLDRQVQVASIQTLSRRAMPRAEMVVVDEAHGAVSPSYARVLDHYRVAGAWVWGCTATPFRLDGRGLAPTFTCIVSPVSVADLCRAGTLVEPTVYAPSQPDLKGVPTQAGEFDVSTAAERMSSLTGDILEHWQRLASHCRTIVFACNVAHSQHLAARFLDAGIPAAHLDGSTSHAERDKVLADLRHGRLQVVTNCAILAEGWDLPALDCAVLARPTKSLCVHIQQIGRIMRAAPDKHSALVLDHAGNHYRHGMITDEITYSLDAPAKKLRAARTFRQCMNCYAIVPLGAQACPQCGHVKIAEPALPSEAKGELKPFKPPTFAEKEAKYREFVLTANERRWKLGWARNAYRNQFGVWPRGFKHIDALFRCEQHVTQYVVNVGYRCERCLRSLPNAVRV